MWEKPMETGDLFDRFPRVETERLLLDQIKPQHADQLLFIRGSVEGAKYGPPPWKDIEQTQMKIAWFKGMYDNRDGVIWGIFLKETRDLIGHINYYIVRQYLGNVGYHLADDQWGRGYATEALRGALKFLYAIPDMHRTQATVHKDHPASIRVLEKVGFTNEGLLRHRANWQGKFVDLYMFSLLRGELILE